jgi:TonB family protein
MSAVQAAASPELQKSIRANTFEVVMKKPEKDTATYEKPLPLELIPFRERNDAYQSVGTAFALGHNTYVTAGHVLEAGVESQYGIPSLRGSDGSVYAIDRILRFSMREDYIVFSLLHGPETIGFAVNQEPKIDDPVLAVGNALGEGIVIRDGLYTSATEEEQDGLWKWIRFSAAASPGNSGGPLLDGDGKVIGIVIGKSPNENLNFALPIGRALDAEQHKAKFDLRMLTTLPYLHGTHTYAFKDGFELPLPWGAFVENYQSQLSHHNDEAFGELLKTYSDSMFPRGPGSESLLFDTEPNGFNPMLIAQQADGTWWVSHENFKVTDLPGDGSVSAATGAGVTLLRLVRPDAAADDAFYGDSKAFMDLALKTLNVRRPVGQDQVRITSLGSARTDALFADLYGRKWQERVWAVPFLDMYIVALLLPTPDGYVAVMEFAPSPLLRETKNRNRLFAGQVSVSLRGSIKQWQAYLRRRSMLPEVFNAVELDKSPTWTFRTKRFSSSVPAAALPLSENSPLTLTMGFSADGTQAEWDIEEVWWNQDERMDSAVGVWRRERPTSGAKLELRNAFSRMHDRRSPYDGQIVRDTAESFALTRMLDVPGKDAGTVSADLLYGVTLRFVEHPVGEAADKSLQSAIDGTHIFERGSGSATSAAPTAAQKSHDFDAEWRQVIAAARKNEAELGPDLRGRTITEDFLGLDVASRFNLSNQNASEFERSQRRQFQALQDYWSNYPSLTHNRDLWVTFLARNDMSPTTPHAPAVTGAEASLLTAMKDKQPSAEWATLARALNAAYIEERSRLVKSHMVAANYRNRVSPCPAPADRTSKKSMPAIARMNRSLQDFWPQESRRLGEEGVVLVSLRISASGCVAAAAIVGSSGSDMLDDAVMHFFESIDFYPAEADGKPIESIATLPITFKLQN